MDNGVDEGYTAYILELQERVGLQRFGLGTNQAWHDDPRVMAFKLTRYKWVGKMLSGRRNVLEIGCGDAFCARLVRQEVARLTVSDSNPILIEDARANASERWPVEPLLHDLRNGPVPGLFDAAYCLDVLEHVPAADEGAFIENVITSLTPHGVFIVGMPSLESQQFASPFSRAGHVNCKTGKDLKALMERYFHTVFTFSMNDEVIHTGFWPMAHYLLAVCCGARESS